MGNFTTNIGKDHYIAGKVNTFFVYFFPVAYLDYFFCRYKDLVNKIFKTFMSDFTLNIFLYFIFLSANGTNYIPLLVFHFCHSNTTYDLIHSKYCSITPLKTVSTPQITKAKMIENTATTTVSLCASGQV